MKIEWITTAGLYKADTILGGIAYDYSATRALRDNFDFDLIYVKKNKSNSVLQRVINEYKFIKDLLNVKLQGDVTIRTHFPIALSPYIKGTKNIGMIHQFYKGITSDGYYLPLFFKNLKKMNVVVTVSKYWQAWFRDRGYKNVEIIYNSFSINEFNFAQSEIHAFKKKYNLPNDKPIIYIGSSGRGKGVEMTYNILKDLKVYLISSGRKNLNDSSIPHLCLNHREYLLLLRCSDIAIQMSQNPEGWCRVLHEAMLCKTPVIGSGKCGMSELLSGGGQIICKNFRNLKYFVKKLLGNKNLRIELGEQGYEFAKDFTRERFNSNWVQLVDNIFRRPF